MNASGSGEAAFTVYVRYIDAANCCGFTICTNRRGATDCIAFGRGELEEIGELLKSAIYKAKYYKEATA